MIAVRFDCSGQNPHGQPAGSPFLTNSKGGYHLDVRQSSIILTADEVESSDEQQKKEPSKNVRH